MSAACLTFTLQATFLSASMIMDEHEEAIERALAGRVGRPPANTGIKENRQNFATLPRGRSDTIAAKAVDEQETLPARSLTALFHVK